MKIKTFRVPCTLENGELLMDIEKQSEQSHLEITVSETDITKMASQVGQYNSNQMSQTKSILKAMGGESFVLRQILVEG